MRGEGDDAGIEPGRPCAKGNQGVHLRRAAQQSRNAQSKKPASRHEKHDRGQREIGDIEPLYRHRSHQPMMERRIEMASHFEHEKRQRQQRGEHNVALEYRGVLVVVMGMVAAGRCDRAQAGLIAHLFHCLEQGICIAAGNRSAFGRQIDRCGGDAIHLEQRFFHPRNAGRASHAFDVKCGGGRIGDVLVHGFLPRPPAYRPSNDGKVNGCVLTFRGEASGGMPMS